LPDRSVKPAMTAQCGSSEKEKALKRPLLNRVSRETLRMRFDPRTPLD
jgi:hypothetical protein